MFDVFSGEVLLTVEYENKGKMENVTVHGNGMNVRCFLLEGIYFTSFVLIPNVRIIINGWKV